MKLWISAEAMADVGEATRLASNEIVSFVNSRLESIDYGEGVKEWAFISILLPNNFYNEIHKYNKRTKEVEFRLKIDHEKFKNATEIEQRKLICQSLLRSIKMFPEVGVKNFYYDRLEMDFTNLAKEKGWL